MKKGFFKKLLKRYGLGFFIKLVPIVGALYPGLTIKTWKELDGDLTGPSGILMLPIAVLLDFCAIVILIIEVWVDLGLVSTFVNWLGFLIVGGWIWARSGSLLGVKNDEEPEEEPDKENGKEKTSQKPTAGENAPAKIPSKQKT